MKHTLTEETRMSGKSTMKTRSTKALLALAVAGNLVGGTPQPLSAENHLWEEKILPEKMVSEKQKASADTAKVFQTTPDMFVSETEERSESVKDKIEKALNDSTNVKIKFFTSALWGVSIWKNAEASSFTEARLWWDASYHITDRLDFLSKWVLDATIMDGNIIPLGVATGELRLTPTDNVSISWGLTTTPAASAWLNPLTVLKNFENPWQKLIGWHAMGSWVRVDYAPTNDPKEASVSAWVFNIKGETEVNASAKYRAIRLTGWKNTKDKHPWWSIWINIGNSSGTFTVDNGKFAWGASISVSPTVTLYGGFTWTSKDEITKRKVLLSEVWWYKTLQSSGHTVIVAAGYNPKTKTLNLYIAILL